MPRVLLTHTPANLQAYYGQRALHGLQALAEVRLHAGPDEMTLSELVQAAHDCDYIVSYRQTAFPADLIAQLPKSVLAILRCAVDIRNIDVPMASQHGIVVTQASPGFVASVSEWIVGAMIEMNRGIGAATALYHQGRQADIRMGRELRGATLGVIGYGRISQYLCPLALALGMRVLVADPWVQVSTPGIEQTDLNSLLAQADHVVCLAVANEQTENLMSAPQFQRMKPDACFTNASRGNLVDEDALLAALNSGHLRAVAMDVGRAPDQMPSLELAQHPRVVASPHIAGLTPEAIEHQSLETVSQVRQLVEGVLPEGTVNGESARRWRQCAERPGGLV
jgi:D-3-phosphoglycerate dehydrogenase / 2-oxoglutarate reductase